MKALSIQINGVHKCVAGVEGVPAVAALSGATENSYLLSVFCNEPHKDSTSFWLAEPIFVDDEVVIRLVDVDTADEPIA